MKKTLTVLGFALCATLAFAQTNVMTTSNKVVDKASHTVDAVNPSSANGYTGSIFTKEGEIFYCDFSTSSSSMYTTGVATANMLVGGQPIPQHTNQGVYGTWHRIADTTIATLQTLVNQYPATLSRFSAFFTIINSDTPNNGFMMMTMIDNYTAWGGDGDNGVFDAFISFSPFSTVGNDMIRTRFYRVYRKFNYDKVYIDYSTNGTTWNSIEYDVKGVDVAVNGNIYGWKSVTLPAALGNQQSVYLRLRYVDESTDDARAQGYDGGYFCMVDDFSIIDVPQHSRRLVSNQYFEGFYQMMPKDLQLPVVWAAELINDGQQPLNNVTGHIYNYASGQAASELLNTTIGTVPADAATTKSIVVDPLGWYDVSTEYHGWGYHAENQSTGNAYYLPTANTGVYHYFSDITMSNFNPVHVYGDTATFDTMRYEVNWMNITDQTNTTRPAGVWARDNGMLRSGSYYCSGLVTESGYSTDPEETHWNEGGYGVLVSYVTGNTVPQGWKILGMELVASTEAGMNAVGAKLNPVLWYDHVNDTNRNYIGFREVSTGASTYTVQQSDVFSATNLAMLEYEANNYPTIRILFPNQPELEANHAYRVGYQLAEDADFAVAIGTNYYTRNDSTFYFSEEEGLKNYGHSLGISNRYTCMVLDAYDGDVHWFSSPTQYPMIRLIVGPGYYVAKTTVSFECDDPNKGTFQDGDYNILCGEIDSIPVGGSASYYVMPEEGYDIDTVFLNGQPIQYQAVTDNNGHVTHGIVTIENVNEPAVLRCKFKVHQTGGFDIANNVTLRLQPNPATSVVRVSMNGVSGKVNMALIDMSGRVVSTSDFNAENGTTINVSNLAKGAYFVRITNNNFSKIEKLIVR